MFGGEVDEAARREAQSVRICAGLILLMITLMLTKVQTTANSGPITDRARLSQRNVQKNNWIHSSEACTPSRSRLVFFAMQKANPILSWQETIPLDPSVLDHTFSMSAQEDFNTGQRTWFATAALNESSPLLDESFQTPPHRQRSTVISSILPLHGDGVCKTGSEPCFAALQMLSAEDCERALFWDAASRARESTGDEAEVYRCTAHNLHNCGRVLFSTSLSDWATTGSSALSSADTSRPFCGEIASNSFAFDAATKELLLMSRSDGASSWSLWRMPIKMREFLSQPSAVPEVNQTALAQSQMLVPISINGRLGYSRQPENLIGIPAHPSRESLSPSDTFSEPLLVFPSSTGMYVSILRMYSDSLLVSIMKRVDQDELVLTSTVQIDSFDSGWVIDAPDSEAGDSLLLMGATPPYAWQVEAVDLATGIVETRHAFIV